MRSEEYCKTDHSDLMDFDCMTPCPECKSYGPHIFKEDYFCNVCGKPFEAYYNKLKEMIGK